MSESSATEAELFTGILDPWLASLHATSVVIVAENAEARAVAEGAIRSLPKGTNGRVVADWADAPKSDVIVVYREMAREGWAAQLEALGKIATHALVVVVKNPRGLVDRIHGDDLAPMCHTKTIAPVLWQIGRVREHVFFGHAFSGMARYGLFEQASPKLLPRVARMHAFLVDTTPRTPQARRKLHTVS